MKYLLVLAIAIVFANSLNYYNEDALFLKKIAKQDFGKSILNQIFAQMEDGDPVNNVVNTLTQLYSEISEGVFAARKASLERQTTCNNKMDELENMIAELKVKLADQEKVLPFREEELANKMQVIDDNNEEMKQTKERMSKFQETRKQEHEEYLERRDEMVSMVNGLQEAKNIMKKLDKTSSHSSSFVELKQNIFAEVKKHNKKLLNEIQNSRNKGLKTLVKFTLSMIEDQEIQADQGAVQKILQIIDDLIESIFEVQQQEMFNDDQKKKYFMEDLHRLELDISRLVNLNIRQNAVADTIKSRLEQLQNKIGTYEMLKENKEMEMEDWKVTCSNDLVAVQESEKEKKDQLEVIDKMLEIFREKFNDNTLSVLSELK